MGCDISESMLNIAKEKESDVGDLVHSDMGLGLPFRPGSFDGVVSISAIQVCLIAFYLFNVIMHLYLYIYVVVVLF